MLKICNIASLRLAAILCVVEEHFHTIYTPSYHNVARVQYVVIPALWISLSISEKLKIARILLFYIIGVSINLLAVWLVPIPFQGDYQFFPKGLTCKNPSDCSTTFFKAQHQLWFVLVHVAVSIALRLIRGGYFSWLKFKSLVYITLVIYCYVVHNEIGMFGILNVTSHCIETFILALFYNLLYHSNIKYKLFFIANMTIFYIFSSIYNPHTAFWYFVTRGPNMVLLWTSFHNILITNKKLREKNRLSNQQSVKSSYFSDKEPDFYQVADIYYSSIVSKVKIIIEKIFSSFIHSNNQNDKGIIKKNIYNQNTFLSYMRIKNCKRFMSNLFKPLQHIIMIQIKKFKTYVLTIIIYLISIFKNIRYNRTNMKNHYKQNKADKQLIETYNSYVDIELRKPIKGLKYEKGLERFNFVKLLYLYEIIYNYVHKMIIINFNSILRTSSASEINERTKSKALNINYKHSTNQNDSNNFCDDENEIQFIINHNSKNNDNQPFIEEKLSIIDNEEDILYSSDDIFEPSLIYSLALKPITDEYKETYLNSENEDISTHLVNSSLCSSYSLRQSEIKNNSHVSSNHYENFNEKKQMVSNFPFFEDKIFDNDINFNYYDEENGFYDFHQISTTLNKNNLESEKSIIMSSNSEIENKMSFQNEQSIDNKIKTYSFSKYIEMLNKEFYLNIKRRFTHYWYNTKRYNIDFFIRIIIALLAFSILYFVPADSPTGKLDWWAPGTPMHEYLYKPISNPKYANESALIGRIRWAISDYAVIVLYASLYIHEAHPSRSSLDIAMIQASTVLYLIHQFVHRLIPTNWNYVLMLGGTIFWLAKSVW